MTAGARTEVETTDGSDRPSSIAAGPRLAVAALAIYVVLGVATLFAATGLEAMVFVPLGFEAGAGSFGHGVFLAIHVIAWAVLGFWLCVLAARVVGLNTAVSRGAWVVVVGGAAAAGLVQLAIHEYARARFGFYDPRAVGLTALLPAAAVGQLVGWALVLVSKPASMLAWSIEAVPLAVMVGIIGLNVPGAADGISPGSLPLAVAMALVLLAPAAMMVFALFSPRPWGGEADDA